jgi:hypothetical protein
MAIYVLQVVICFGNFGVNYSDPSIVENMSGAGERVPRIVSVCAIVRFIIPVPSDRTLVDEAGVRPISTIDQHYANSSVSSRTDRIKSECWAAPGRRYLDVVQNKGSILIVGSYRTARQIRVESRIFDGDHPSGSICAPWSIEDIAEFLSITMIYYKSGVSDVGLE